MKKILSLFTLTLLISTLTGCLGYQLEGSRPLSVKKIHMPAVLNKTSEPGIEIELTKALIGRIQFDGRTQIMNREADADTFLNVTVTSYRINAVSFQRDRKTTAEEYRLRMHATATLTDAKTDEIISSVKNYGEAIFIVKDDMTSSKRKALPQATEDLAKYLIDDLIERW